jgi:hypothetical protein
VLHIILLWATAKGRSIVAIFSSLRTKVHYRLKKCLKNAEQLFIFDSQSFVPLRERYFNSNVEYKVKFNVLEEEKRRQLRRLQIIAKRWSMTIHDDGA